MAWESVSHFFSGGASEILEKLKDFLSEQIVPPEKLPQEDLPPVVGESGAGGEFPSSDLRKAAEEGQTLAPYQLTAQMISPVSGLVTSMFGWREHPVSHQDDFHKGVDICSCDGYSDLGGSAGSGGRNRIFRKLWKFCGTASFRSAENHL